MAPFYVSFIHMLGFLQSPTLGENERREMLKQQMKAHCFCLGENSRVTWFHSFSLFQFCMSENHAPIEAKKSIEIVLSRFQSYNLNRT